MFGVSYDTWKSICNMYFSLNAGSQKAYLQWFPFTKLSSADKENISGEEFYNSYIKTASFMLFPPAMHQSENYLQKGDGSFRDSSLVAPVLFLFLQSIPSFNKDTHAFRQRKSALTASSRRRGLRFMSGRYSYGIGTPPTLRRSASPHEVLRPCGDPAAAYASMPASSSLSSSGLLSPKSPAEFLRGRNGARGSAER